jgi:hypothetical protein
VLDLVDALLAARVQRGEAEFQQRCALHPRPSRSSRS